ncbi:uncharacterized protein [Blastocystis hominis]|uniref:Uncharacterized protein n=1 Tax=Blastocystis hominis TaxID=12968 RepID=D8M9G0_BLAHO|nr:uncharacterized protein [Blastocystis hominis]CBK24699.2 unnamed protein product [Blastocystis hominis]|eukprot:XP_012898747.1 uncharacterized protein [Blastocystis hominis]
MNCNLTEKQKYMMLYSGIREYYSPENHFDSTMMESFFEMRFRKTIELSPYTNTCYCKTHGCIFIPKSNESFFELLEEANKCFEKS